MEHVVYNGVDLSERFIVLGVVRPLPTPTPAVELVSGGNRNNVRGIDLVPPTLSFRLVTRERDRLKRRDQLRWLASVLLVNEPVMVKFSSDDGKSYKVVPTGDLSFHEFVQSGYMDVTLQCVESAMYGKRFSVTSSSETATFLVKGNYQTPLRIESTNAVRRSSSDYRFGYTLDNGPVAYLEIPTGSSSTVIMDSETRDATVNGSVAQLTLQSDWLEVQPGSHTLRRTMGSGEFTVSWVERWL